MLLTSCRATSRQLGRSGKACVHCAVGGSLIVAAAAGLASHAALAQSLPPTSDVAPSERAKRDADKVFHWIMIQGDRTRKASSSAAKDAKDDRPTAKPTRPAAPEAVPVPVRQKAEPAVAVTPTAPMTSPATTPAAAPAASPPVDKRVEVAVTEAAAPASAATPAAVPEAPKADEARLAGIERSPAPTAPAVDVAQEAPQGLVALAQPAPQFPVNVMRALRRGSVQVQFNVLPDGSVAKPEVLKTTNARLNAAALEAIAQWRFQPVSTVQSGAVEVGFNLE